MVQSASSSLCIGPATFFRSRPFRFRPNLAVRSSTQAPKLQTFVNRQVGRSLHAICAAAHDHSVKRVEAGSWLLAGPVAGANDLMPVPILDMIADLSGRRILEMQFSIHRRPTFLLGSLAVVLASMTSTPAISAPGCALQARLDCNRNWQSYGYLSLEACYATEPSLKCPEVSTPIDDGPNPNTPCIYDPFSGRTVCY
jgi:hypothetical protein